MAQVRIKDGVAWRIGADSDVEWLRDGVRPALGITSAIPPMFADYATLELPGSPDVPRDVADEARQDRALLAVLQRHTPAQPWWLAGHRRN